MSEFILHMLQLQHSPSEPWFELPEVEAFGVKHLLFLDGFKIPLRAQKCSNCKACPSAKFLLRVCPSLSRIFQEHFIWAFDFCFVSLHIAETECISSIQIPVSKTKSGAWNAFLC